MSGQTGVEGAEGNSPAQVAGVAGAAGASSGSAGKDRGPTPSREESDKGPPEGAGATDTDRVAASGAMEMAGPAGDGWRQPEAWAVEAPAVVTPTAGWAEQTTAPGRGGTTDAVSRGRVHGPSTRAGGLPVWTPPIRVRGGGVTTSGAARGPTGPGEQACAGSGEAGAGAT